MNKIKAKLYLWFLEFISPIDLDLKVIFAVIIGLIILLFGYIANAQTITKYYDNSNKIRNALTFFNATTNSNINSR